MPAGPRDVGDGAPLSQAVSGLDLEIDRA